jgi:hypothetical protein
MAEEKYGSRARLRIVDSASLFRHLDGWSGFHDFVCKGFQLCSLTGLGLRLCQPSVAFAVNVEGVSRARKRPQRAGLDPPRMRRLCSC